MKLCEAIVLALAACVAAPAPAVELADQAPPPALTPAPAQAPAPEPLVPLPIATPPPVGQPPITGTTMAPELAPLPATEVGEAPVPPADTVAPAPARPILPMNSGQELFTRLRARLGPDSCEAGSNSARWRQRYAGHPAAFSHRLETVLPLIDFVSTEVERSGLPAQFTFIPLVESWYQPGAMGPGGPAGMWQMIATTAKNHGIHIRDGYDGRLSPVESTRAALSYLRVLQDMFGDWQAIVMAYNAGEGRMQNALRRAGSRVTSAADRRPHGLSNITYDYVDKLQALSCLVSRPERFGLHLPVEARYEPLVPQPMDPGMDTLEQFARAHGQDANLVRALNPGFRGGRVVAGVPRLVLSPPGRDVPQPAPMDASEPPPAMLALEADDEIEIAMLLDAALEQAAIDANGDDAIAPPSLASAEVEPAPAPAPAMAMGDDSELPMVADARPVTVTVSEKTFAEPPAPIHQVREGESLWSISQYYHVPVEQIRRANKLDAKATVHAGQVLQLVP
jgi:membrane-bound lytic murein transglycosylase D